MSQLRSCLFSLLLIFGLAGVALAAPVDINSADADTLASVLVGVGPQKAQAIVRYREQNGHFNSIDELALVKGIGTSTVEKNRDRITAVPIKQMATSKP